MALKILNTMLVLEKRERQVVFHLSIDLFLFGVADIDTPQVQEGKLFSYYRTNTQKSDRKCCLCNDICKWLLFFLVFPDKDDKP